MHLILTLISNIIFLILIICIAIYAYFLYSYQYWARKKVPYLDPKFPNGNCRNVWSMVKGYPVGLADSCYKEIRKRGWKYGGFFTLARPTLLVVDPEYVKDILTKDFHHFVDRGFYHKKGDPLSESIFVMDETNWKDIRSKLTPTFTSGKIKMMFPLIINASNQMITFLDKKAEKQQDIDIKQCLDMFTTDVIVSCAFGLESNCFTDPNHQFRNIGNGVDDFRKFFETIEVTLMNYAPDLALKMKIRSVKKETSQFFQDLIGSTIKYRKDNNVTREDFLQLMINLLESTKHLEKPFTFQQVVSQVGIFFVAGFQTSSSTMNLALYELARNPDFQEKLRQEILATLKNYGGEPSYESINEMKYLQKIVEETLRLYPVVSNVQRKCIKDYTLRNTDIVIEKGVPVLIPVFNLQRDPEYFEDPLKFDPERFSPENKEKIVPYSYLPFGEGPRNCIGLRFGLMQTKLGLIQILRNFRIRISPSTKMPMELNTKKFILHPLHTLYLQAEKL